ncbi:MAG: hypothetical protein QXF41_02770 [Candidatus Micrarchaeaceae archaeon]
MAENFEEFEKFINSEKGKRKFKQSVELAINFKGIDFSKQENRLNMSILLPHPKGKSTKLAVFANSAPLISESKKLGIEVINGSDIATIASDKLKLKSLLNYTLFAEPALMPVVAKSLGQFLGPRDMMPKPLMDSGALSGLSAEADRRITLKSKGKYLPTVHCMVGKEDMQPKEIYENVEEVLNSIAKKLGRTHIKSVYVKLSMSKPFRLI